MNSDINKSIGTSVICYFCNETIANRNLLQNHANQCGSILEKCPTGCGSWVERRHRISHSRKCPATGTYYRPRSNTVSSRATLNPNIYQVLEEQAKEDNYKSIIDNIDYLKKEVLSLKQIIHEERESNSQLKNELEKMRRQYVLSEERNQLVVATMTAIRRTTEEESMKQKIITSELKEEAKELKKKNQDCENYIIQKELRFQNLKETVEQETTKIAQLELVLNNQDVKIRNIYKLEADLDEIKRIKNQETLLRDDQIFKIQQQLNELKELVFQENAIVKQKLQNFQSVNNENSKNDKMASDITSKLEVIDYEMKSLKIVVEEDSSTIGMMDKKISTLSQTISHLKDTEKVVEIEHDKCNIPQRVVDTSGHLIWKIECYHQKLKDAIDNGTILLSPIFLTNKYGYTLQAELNLNGIGKWQGRHLTASVTIVSGEFDSILSWPVNLQADIILKDQTQKRSESMDIVKTVSIRRKDFVISKKSKSIENIVNEDQSNQSLENGNSVKRQYIFIPHTSLDKFDYIKNNVMYLEIIVSNQ